MFNSWKIGNLQIPNRIMRSATWEGLGDPNTKNPTQTLTEAYVKLAENNVGLIVTGLLAISASGVGPTKMVGIYTRDQIDGLARTVEKVHNKKGLIAAQLGHVGGNISKIYLTNRHAYGPSARIHPLSKKEVKELSHTQIEDIIADFAKAAQKAKEAGFDAIQLHMAHGYLISEFLTPKANLRTDEYGQDKGLFALQVFQEARNYVSKDFPLLVKINSEDLQEGGLTLEESLQVMYRLNQAGADAIEISGGIGFDKNDSPVLKVSKPEEEGYFLNNAIKIKETVDCPVICVGGWRSIAEVEKALAKVDAVSLSRPLICQPDLIQLWAHGQCPTAKCISCNRCFMLNERYGLSCALWGRGTKKQTAADI